MPETTSSSSWPPVTEPLIRVPLSDLLPHPMNANRMDEESLAKLVRNIEHEGRYPPIIARSHPARPRCWQSLDGEHRRNALQQLGHTTALVYRWECSDEEALRLLATLNRLEGMDVPATRAVLLAELEDLVSADELARFLPESADAIRESRALLDLDADALLAELEAAAERADRTAVRSIAFAVTPEDESTIESAVAHAVDDLEGRNRRGRALAGICRRYLEAIDD